MYNVLVVIFCFSDEQPPAFEIEISVYSARTDNNIDYNQTIRQRLTRSLGRRLGGTVKSNMTSDAVLYQTNLNCPDTPANSSFRLVGKTALTLSDIGSKVTVLDLHLSPDAESYAPPLYGHLCCRVVAQPLSVTSPLADGHISIRELNENRLYEDVPFRLQAGVLRCSVNRQGTDRRNGHQLILIHLNKDSEVLPARVPCSLLLMVKHDENMTRVLKKFLITAHSEEDISALAFALHHQLTDIDVWGESFATSSISLTSTTNSVLPTSLRRDNGRCLYDEIQIGDCSEIANRSCPTYYTNSPPYHLIDPSVIVPLSKAPSYSQTAPSGRRKDRTNVQSLFKDERERPKYVINLAVGDVTERDVNENYGTPNNVDDFVYPRMSREYQHSDSTDSQDSGRFRSLKKSWQRSFGALLSRKVNESVRM
ncbi:hypothetical protein AB6A40_010247 [Gnathostoma spinigerum]|uniref:Anillin homology domain-containing protein n=1 Tax=Gnathostoma spinigerum TaxID=75299 RepID=A0ABD6EUQ0_9BILA